MSDESNTLKGRKHFDWLTIYRDSLVWTSHDSVPMDGPFELRSFSPTIALISGFQGNHQEVKRFYAMSMTPEKRIMTAHICEEYNGLLKIQSEEPEHTGVLENIEFEHVNNPPNLNPKLLLKRHLEKIADEEGLIEEGLLKASERTYFDLMMYVKRY
jgi:hypothetical protein